MLFANNDGRNEGPHRSVRANDLETSLKKGRVLRKKHNTNKSTYTSHFSQQKCSTCQFCPSATVKSFAWIVSSHAAQRGLCWSDQCRLQSILFVWNLKQIRSTSISSQTSQVKHVSACQYARIPFCFVIRSIVHANCPLSILPPQRKHFTAFGVAITRPSSALFSIFRSVNIIKTGRSAAFKPLHASGSRSYGGNCSCSIFDRNASPSDPYLSAGIHTCR